MLYVLEVVKGVRRAACAIGAGCDALYAVSAGLGENEDREKPSWGGELISAGYGHSFTSAEAQLITNCTFKLEHPSVPEKM